jgi:hypothetical protein
MQNTNSTIISEFKAIEEVLHSIKPYGLEAEVIHYALRAMKANPEMTIEDAIWSGHNEWIK